MRDFPRLRAVVLDTTDARRLAEFYRRLLGYSYRPSDEPPPAGEPALHLDLTVADPTMLAAQRDRAVELGAQILHDRSSDPDEPLYVFADPAGHPFCMFVSGDHPMP